MDFLLLLQPRPSSEPQDTLFEIPAGGNNHHALEESVDSSCSQRRVIFPCLHDEEDRRHRRSSVQPTIDSSHLRTAAPEEKLELPTMSQEEQDRLRVRLDAILPLASYHPFEEHHEETSPRSPLRMVRKIAAASTSPRCVGAIPLVRTPSLQSRDDMDIAMTTTPPRHERPLIDTTPPPAPSPPSSVRSGVHRKLMLDVPVTPIVKRTTRLYTPEAMTPPAPIMGKKNPKKQLQPLPSILRKAKTRSPVKPLLPIPSVASDIPSLASTLSSTSSQSLESTASTAPPEDSPILSARSLPGYPPAMLSPATGDKRCLSERCPSTIKFDPRVWIREFHRPESESIWYNQKELDEFKREAMHRIMRFSEPTELLATGTGRILQKRSSPKKLLFSHKALGCDAEDDENEQIKRRAALEKQELARKEIKRVLLVDPHEICLKLLSNAFQNMMPHAEVVTASSSSDALKLATEDTFDVVVVEERMAASPQRNIKKHCTPRAPQMDHHVSGSLLLRKLSTEIKSSAPLMIGLTAHVEQDKDRLLQQGGADSVWPKPPPRMDEGLRDLMLGQLLEKRGRAPN